jgi:hypothetical protein
VPYRSDQRCVHNDRRLVLAARRPADQPVKGRPWLPVELIAKLAWQLVGREVARQDRAHFRKQFRDQLVGQGPRLVQQDELRALRFNVR